MAPVAPDPIIGTCAVAPPAVPDFDFKQVCVVV